MERRDTHEEVEGGRGRSERGRRGEVEEKVRENKQ